MNLLSVEDAEWNLQEAVRLYGATHTCEAGPAGEQLQPGLSWDDVRWVVRSWGFDDESGTEIVGVLKLKDGRYAIVEGSCDFTGWESQSGAIIRVAADLARAKNALSKENRERLGYR